MDKRCSRCGETKPLVQFGFNRSHKDGRAWWCKTCTNEAMNKSRSNSRKVYRKSPVRHVEPPAAKKCYTCKEIKPIDEFHKDAGRPDGHAVRCKLCAVEITRANYAENRERHKNYQREHRAANVEHYKELRRDYGKRFPERVRANNLVNNQVAAGKLVPAKTLKCEKCGRQARHYHHPDYSKPLEVLPLCESCHRRLHGLQTADAGN